MFNLELIGIVYFPNSICDYDQVLIDKFERGIEIIDGQVNVEL